MVKSVQEAKMNNHMLSTFSLLTHSRCSINLESAPESRHRYSSPCPGAYSPRVQRGTGDLCTENRRLSVPSTLNIARSMMQESIPEFVIPTRKTMSRNSTLTAKAELMAYLDDKEVQDYNIVIKKEMLGENVSSIKRRIVYDNVKVFELHKSFPRYHNQQDFDCV